MLTPRPQTRSIQNCGPIIFCGLRYSFCGAISQGPWEMNIVSRPRETYFRATPWHKPAGELEAQGMNGEAETEMQRKAGAGRPAKGRTC